MLDLLSALMIALKGPIQQNAWRNVVLLPDMFIKICNRPMRCQWASFSVCRPPSVHGTDAVYRSNIQTPDESEISAQVVAVDLLHALGSSQVFLHPRQLRDAGMMCNQLGVLQHK